MCSPSAYNSYLEYAEVFPKIAELLNPSGVTATIKDNKDKNGLVVQITLPDRVGELNDGERDNWSIDFGSEVIELDIPVQNRDAEAIAKALLKAIGK